MILRYLIKIDPGEPADTSSRNRGCSRYVLVELPSDVDNRTISGAQASYDFRDI